ncbi:lytic polysaccharide monooxygenase [Aquabacterium sp. A7-Y]|uniref:lytic polysaccharide monooxygenase n=1 Tax=Aquabacterium sp. A7-Y TaxID=1349605 RepID=UPI00223C9E3A|nr:lytic polysaccharide monooxygenase [Aquabacterium sp. A7-Y]MCW7537957.1 lytic polysaccharide monooxygenase [Aquabacterium sp. A7-Y]
MLKRLPESLALAAAAWSACGAASAHGLIQDPPSRNWFCGAVTKPDHSGSAAQHPECAQAFASDPSGGYNFMSVLTHTRGRTAATPLPKNVCGFDSESWKGGATPWDTAMNWPTSKMSAGRNKITWNILWGPHFDDTEEFRYWITKPGFVFSPNKPLAWSDFEPAPFCTLKYNDKNPTANPDVVAAKGTHQFHTYCTVPARSGRHVIYGEWGRLPPTLERFHGCADVVFDASGTPAPKLEARIAAMPDVKEIAGEGSLLLDGSGSVGTGLSYKWTINAPNPGLYSFENSAAAITRLNFTAPAAAGTVQVSLQVTGADGTSSASKSFTHKPVNTSRWTDLGALASAGRTLQAGDKVQLRLVLSNGQDRYLPAAPLSITAANAGASTWPLALARAVNAAGGSVRVGVLSGTQITPTAHATANRVYAAGSDIASAHVQVRGVAAPLTASYTVTNDWNSGYCATIKVTNHGASVANWSVSMPVQGTVNQVWNAVHTQSGSQLKLSGPPWNLGLAAGASFTQAGFCADK